MLERELNCKAERYSGLSGVLKLADGDKEVVITDDFFGITWISFDIENNLKDHPDIAYKPVVSLFDYVSDSTAVFATSNDKGIIKVWHRVSSEENEEVLVEIEPLRKFIGHKGKVNAMSYFRDGSFISAGEDGTFRIWTARRDVLKVGKSDGGSACCGGK